MVKTIVVNKYDRYGKQLQQAALLSFCKFMCISRIFCEENLRVGDGRFVNRSSSSLSSREATTRRSAATSSSASATSATAFPTFSNNGLRASIKCFATR